MAQLTMPQATTPLSASSRWVATLRRIMRCKECYLLLVPTFALILLFNYYPAASALYHSFFNWDGANFKQFSGLANFRTMLKDAIIWQALGNMIKLTVISVVINLTFPLVAAALIFHLRDLRLAYFYRVLFVVPMVVPGMVTLMIWRFIYNPNIGLLNQILKAIGLGTWARPWLGDFNLALYAIIFIGFPWVSAFAILGFLIAVFYVGPPLRLAYRGLGELGIFLAYGPLIILGSYYVQALGIGGTPILASLIPGALILSLAILNEIPDYYQDLLVGKRNVVVRLGKKKGAVLYASALVWGYVVLALGAFSGSWPRLSLLILLTLPLAFKSIRLVGRYYDEPKNLLPAVNITAILYLAINALFALSFVIS